jgi:hypothetical protein
MVVPMMVKMAVMMAMVVMMPMPVAMMPAIGLCLRRRKGEQPCDGQAACK